MMKNTSLIRGAFFVLFMYNCGNLGGVVMEENYDLEGIDFRKQKLIDVLQERIYEFASAIDKEDFIIEIYVEEFVSQAQEFESICALKLVLEGVIDDYEMNTENVLYKINSLIDGETEYELYQDTQVIDSQNSGYIYLMMNPSMNGIVKIGLTKRTPEERLNELSKATGVPTPFILVYKEKFNDCVRAEKIIHSLLEERGERVSSNREFFSTETSEAIKIIQQVKENYDIVDSNLVEQSYEWYDDKPISKEYLEKGIDYLNGYGNHLQDYDRAIEYLEKAGELGEAQAYYELGNLYIDTMKDEEFSLDVKKAIKYFEKGRELNGKYANYCNAGLALCYANDYFTYSKIKNYTKNDANAEKCWEWFFNNLDFNNSDYLAGSHIYDCLKHFLVNKEVSSVYKNKLDVIATPFITKCRYDQYDKVKDFSLSKDILQYLLGKFKLHQLDREVRIKWIPIKEIYEEEGIEFKVLIEEGFLKDNDIISFNGYSGAYRTIEGLWKDGIEVSILNKGEKGIIRVKTIIDDFGGYLSDNLSISVLGNDTLEERVEEIFPRKMSEENETATEKGIFGKVKGWFS